MHGRVTMRQEHTTSITSGASGGIHVIGQGSEIHFAIGVFLNRGSLYEIRTPTFKGKYFFGLYHRVSLEYFNSSSRPSGQFSEIMF